MTGASEESVFAKALEIDDVQERAAFLDRACAGNPALRKNVLSLLSAYGAGQFLERPAPALAGTTDERSNATGCFLGGKVRKSAMAIHVQCPRCHALSHVDVTSATAVISCPRCQAKLPRLGDFATAPAPAQVGRFRVRRELGAGVSGTVYEAYDP